MMIPTKKDVDTCIRHIDEGIKKGNITNRGNAISFAAGFFTIHQVVPIQVLNHINEMYYTGKIEL